jgi:hypothetical protein
MNRVELAVMDKPILVRGPHSTSVGGIVIGR